MIKKILLILLVIFIIGCTKEVYVEVTKYVCPKGEVVSSPENCPKTELAEPKSNETNESVQKNKTTIEKSPYFTAKELNQVSEEILNRINEERNATSLPPYIQSRELQSAAQDYSYEFRQKGVAYPSQEELNQRLDANKIFYFESGENLAIISRANDTNISEEVMKKWMEGIGQRELLLDKGFTHGGIGISCNAENCYVVLDLIAAKKSKYSILGPDDKAFQSIYNTTFPYNFSINFTIRLDSKQKFAFYIVANESSYERFQEGFWYNPVYSEKDVRNKNFSLIAEKGYGIIFTPLERYSDTVIFYELEFNEFVR